MQTKIKEKYTNRLKELIAVGNKLPVINSQRISSVSIFTEENTYEPIQYLSSAEFNQWKTNCISILDVIIPASSIHRSTLDKFQGLSNKTGSKAFGVSFLKAIVDDFESGYLDNLYNQIDAELNADFLTQAESIIENKSIETSYIAVAVISGAVLEHGLRNICSNIEPPEPTENNGKPLMLNSLIDSLKKREVYNELMAKQLRSYAAIRNAAAHGKFDEFTPDQVSNMINGISSFLASHS
jgi:hypothetical protein